MSSVASRPDADPDVQSLRVEVYESLERLAVERLESAKRRDRFRLLVRWFVIAASMLLVTAGGVGVGRGPLADTSTLLILGAGVGGLSAALADGLLARDRVSAVRRALLERDLWHSMLARARHEEATPARFATPPGDMPGDAAVRPPPLATGTTARPCDDDPGNELHD